VKTEPHRGATLGEYRNGRATPMTEQWRCGVSVPSFPRLSRRRRDEPGRLRLAERVRADLLFEVPPEQAPSLGRWLCGAAVVAEVGAGGVTVRARRNRVFSLGDLAMLVREWMQAHAVDAVLASCDGVLFSIVQPQTEARR
jgi:hypothetical protein